MQDVHPSLVEYISLFPPSALSPGINIYPDLNSQSYSLDQSILHGTCAFPQYFSNTEPSNSSCAQIHTDPAGASSQQAGFVYDSVPCYDYQQPYAATPHTSANTPEAGDLTDLGMMMNGDSGIDEHWISFMRESGIIQFDPSNAA